MSNTLTDEGLRRAASKLREARLAVQPSLEEYEHEFSPRFEQAMDELMGKGPRKAVWRKAVSAAASLLLVLLIGAGAVLTFNQEARASFVTWLREQYEDIIVYRFWNNGNDSALPTYRIGWMPEGFVLQQEFDDELGYNATYQYLDDERHAIVFTYGEERNALTIWGDLENSERLTIQGFPGEYVPSDYKEGGDLVWIDENSQIVFTLSATLEKDIIIKMANSVYLVK